MIQRTSGGLEFLFRWKRTICSPKRSVPPVAGVVLAVIGLVVILISLPGWFWLTFVGVGLIWMGWVLITQYH